MESERQQDHRVATSQGPGLPDCLGGIWLKQLFGAARNNQELLKSKPAMPGGSWASADSWAPFQPEVPLTGTILLSSSNSVPVQLRTPNSRAGAGAWGTQQK